MHCFSSLLPLLVALSCLILTACGEEAGDPIPPRERCIDRTPQAFVAGSVSLTPNAASEISKEVATASGVVEGSALYLTFPAAAGSKPLLLKLYVSDTGGGLVDRIAESIEQGRSSFEVVDATTPIAGSQNISGLNNYTCSFAEGKICAQIVVDENNDGLVSDDDGRVYNAAGGEIVFTEVRGLSSTFSMNWVLTLGANLLNAEDTIAGNALSGCLNTSYSSDGGNRWQLGG